MSRPFVHLHNHTEYSLLDGATKIKDLVRRVKELDMPAVAISDHGSMFGAVEFYDECKSNGVKPIIGMEAYVAPRGLETKKERIDRANYHLLLLAKNDTGYRNLCRLHAIGALEGFYSKPRIDIETLRKHSEGLIGSTTCIGSQVNQTLLKEGLDEAREMLAQYRDCFAADSFFLELMDHGHSQQKDINEVLVRWSKQFDLPLVATNDGHFLCKEAAPAHDLLWCIGTNDQVNRPDREKVFLGEEYVKTADEMAALFPEHPEAIENSLRIAEMCDVSIEAERNVMPNPDLPEGATPNSHLRTLAEQGLEDRISNVDDQARERLNYELDVIEKTGYESYFLLVREFAQFTRESGIMFGVRGSAAGSLVSYTLGITDVDPLKYRLTFERFLNPERVTMPDVDMDFEDVRREEVIRHVTEKYGKDKVAQIVTLGRLKAKAAIRDAARALGRDLSEGDRLCRLISDSPAVTLDKTLNRGEGNPLYSPEFRDLYDKDPQVKSLVDAAKGIEGTARQAGVHAAGVVIAGTELTNLVPLWKDTNGQAITAYEMKSLDRLGMLKMDFLGLSNLTVIARAIDNIRDRIGKKADTEKAKEEHPVLEGIWNIPLDDTKAFELLGNGETTGIFQLESTGMRSYVTELKPKSVQDLAAMVALYRPGPMKEIPTYIKRQHGKEKITYPHPLTEQCLEETYGVIVYQDQVMEVVRAVAGFTLGKADILRRAMGKKKQSEMDRMKPEYMAGAKEKGVSEADAEKIWELLLPFAGYAFNKAHAVCYGMVAYQSAYLKANYPTEFMAAILAAYRTKEDRVVTIINECTRKGIKVTRPDINKSRASFAVQRRSGKATIRFGLQAIKGVGGGLSNSLIAEREESGDFIHIYDIALRGKQHGLNKTSLEALIKAGALDGLEKNRQTLLDHVEAAFAYADREQKRIESGQDSLFGEGGSGEEEEMVLPVLPPSPKPDRMENLAMEKEVMGIYVSDHPLRGREADILRASSHRCIEVQELKPNSEVALAGRIDSLREITTRQGKLMWELGIEDFSGRVRCIAFPKTVAELHGRVKRDDVVVIEGRTQKNRDGSEIELIVEGVGEVPETPRLVAQDPNSEGVVLLSISRAKATELDELQKLIEESPGNHELAILFADEEAPLMIHRRIEGTDEVLQKMSRMLTSASAYVMESAAPA